jgi:carboxyl-terminal processing protease
LVLRTPWNSDRNTLEYPAMRATRICLLACLLLSISCSGLSQAAETFTPSPAARSPEPSSTPVLPATPVPPAYVPPQCANLPISTLPAATTVALATAELQTNPAIGIAEQLDVLDGLVHALQDHYIYPEAIDQDWLAQVDATRTKVEAGLDTDAFYTDLETLVTALGDEHSYFQTPLDISNEKASLAGIYNVVGIGALLQPMLPEGRVTILEVLPGSPAEHAGLLPHDSIRAVDGMPIGEPGSVHREWTRGPECSAVVLTVQTPGQAPRDLTLVRTSVTASLSVEPRLVNTSDGSRVGYIFIPTMLDETIGDDVRQALDSFGPLDGLIIDNRMNGGGLGSVATQILGFFTSGLVGDFVSRDDSSPWEIKPEAIADSQDVPLAVLIGEDTVSYGELMSGVLQSIGRASLVGQTTLGNVEQLHEYDFDDGSRAWLASARFESLDPTADWEASGIVPDLEVIAPWDSFTFETDPAVVAALSLLGH